MFGPSSSRSKREHLGNATRGQAEAITGYEKPHWEAMKPHAGDDDEPLTDEEVTFPTPGLLRESLS